MTDEEKEKLLDLIKQAKEGNQNAFTRLYVKYNRLIYKVIYDIVLNREVAHDLLSVTFTKAFLKLNSYTYHISFEMWLKTIAINSSIDFIRRTKRQKYDYELDDEDNYLQVSSSADYSPEEVYICNETSTRLSEALNRLKPNYRRILELRTEKDLSYKEIGDILGITESQVKSRLNVAREKLKQLLN